MCTPVAPVPGFGLARSTASLATSFVVPPPIETESFVVGSTRFAHALRRLRERLVLVEPFVPPRSMYHSSTLAPSTTGAKRSSTARISRLFSPHARRGRERTSRLGTVAARARSASRTGHRTSAPRTTPSRRRRGSRASADDQERRSARALGIDHPRDGDEEASASARRIRRAVIGRGGLARTASFRCSA